MDGEYLVIAGWPVQFLPPTSALIEEALANTRDVDADCLANILSRHGLTEKWRRIEPPLRGDTP